ncbi:MAG: hypothetical protein ACK4IK_06105 [Bacteroidia bacterium]
MIKKLSVLLILIILLFNSMGVFIIFKYEQTLVRKEIKRRIKFGVPKNERLLISIPKWMEETPNKVFKRIHKGEFKYKGEMYDILYAKEESDTTHYIVIHDPKETNLFAQLDEHLKKYNDWDTHHNPLSKSKKEIKKYKKDYFNTFNETEIYLLKNSISFFEKKTFYKSITLLRECPPPVA